MIFIDIEFKDLRVYEAKAATLNKEIIYLFLFTNWYTEVPCQDNVTIFSLIQATVKKKCTNFKFIPNLHQLIAFLQNDTWGLKVLNDFLTNENINNDY